MMNETNSKVFFELLKIGLWGKSSAIVHVESPICWDEIRENAQRQTVSAIVFDGLEHLLLNKNLAVEPSKTFKLKWFSEVSHIERQNKKVQLILRKVHQYLKELHIPYLLLKGQSCASYYLNPLHRQSGDIDLFIGDREYKRLIDVLHSKNITMGDFTRKHFDCNIDGVEIEFHRLSCFLYNPFLNKKLQNICRKEEWRKSNYLFIDGLEIRFPAPTYNVFFIFMHFYIHFLQVGIGLRQICDWVLILKKEENNIDWISLEKYVRSVGAMRAWLAFYHFSCKYLGLKLKRVPRWMEKKNESDVTYLNHDIIAAGNFGKYGVSMKTRTFGKGIFYNINSYYHLILRQVKTFKFCPMEVACYPPYKVLARSGIIKY